MNSLKFPPSFPSGDVNASGSIDLDQAWAALLDQPFSPTTKPLAAVSLSANSSLAMGSGPLKFQAGGTGTATSRMRVFWPDPSREKDPMLDVSTIDPEFDRKPADGTGPIGVLLALDGTAEVNADAAGSYGALAGKLGVQTGSKLTYAHLVFGKQSDKVHALLAKVIGKLQLPQSVRQLEEGQTVALSLGGRLKLNASLTWGYTLSAVQQLDVGDLSGSLAYSAKLGPSLSIEAGVSGEFRFQATGMKVDGQPGWVRLTVHRASDRFAGAAVDFSAKVEYKADGFDRSFYDTLAILFGIDAQTLSDIVQRADKYSSLDALKKQAGELLHDEIDALIGKWFPAGIQSTDLAGFVARLGRAANAYATLDQRVHAFLAKHLDATSDEIMNRVAAYADPAVLRQALANRGSGKWQEISDLLGPTIDDVLGALNPVEAARDALNQFKDAVLTAAQSGVKDLMQSFDPSEKAKSLLEELAKIQTTTDVKNAADKQVGALIAQLLEKSFGALATKSEVDRTLRKIQAVTQRIKDLEARWPDIVRKAAEGKFTAEFAAAYKRASSNDSLLSACFNLREETGRQLYREALAGDFTKLVDQPKSLVRLERGLIQNRLSRETTLSVAILGQSASRMFKITQESAISLEPGDSGEIVVDTTKTAAYVRDTSVWFGDRETKASQLALLLSAPLAVDAGNKRLLGQALSMGASYDMSVADEKTTREELTEYLQFAQELGLTDSAAQLAGSLAELAGNGPHLGALELKYAVSLAPEAMQMLFTNIEPAEINYYGRMARRRYYRRYYLARRKRDLADAYTYRVDAAGNAIGTMFTTNELPSAGFYADTVYRLYKTEHTGITALIDFDNVIDDVRQGKITDPNAVKKAALALISARESIDLFLRANYSAFFAILDALILYAGGTRGGYRKSRMEMTLTPPPDARAKPIKVVLAA